MISFNRCCNTHCVAKIRKCDVVRYCLPLLEISSKRTLHADNGESISKSHLAQLSFTSYGHKGGNSTPVIILHGLMGSKQNWNSIGKALHSKLGKQIVSVDVRNHGQSEHKPEMTYELMSEDLKNFLTSHDLSPASIIGHSMGGRMAMYFSLQNPSMLDKLVVVDISPIGASPSLHLMKAYFKALRKITVPSGISIINARKAIDQQLATTIKDAAVRQFLLTNLVVNDDRSFGWKVNLDALEKHFDSDIARFPPIGEKASFTKPTLFIAGGRSDYLRPPDEDGIKRLFPEARFKYVSEAGHWVHADQPNTFIELVTKFLT